MKKQLVLAVVGLGLALAALPSSAEVLVTGFGGKAFGGALDQSRTTYGVGLAFMGGGALGFEAEYGRIDDFLGDGTSLDTNKVESLNANLMLAAPTGVVRLYGTAGVGLLRSKVADRTSFLDIQDDSVGYNLGGGLLINAGQHFALRGDIRYFKTFGNVDFGTTTDLGKLDYWRGVGGLVLLF
jgi:hypothetical protein